MTIYGVWRAVPTSCRARARCRRSVPPYIILRSIVWVSKEKRQPLTAAIAVIEVPVVDLVV